MSFFSQLRILLTRKGSDKLIYLATYVLVGLGIVMIGSAAIGSVTDNGTGWAITRMVYQAGFAVIGSFFMIMLSKKFKPRWLNYNNCLKLFCLGLLLMTICFFFSDTKGSHAWIPIGPFTIQPAEFMKIFMILIMSYFLTETDGAFPKKSFTTKAELEKYRREKLKYSVGIPVLLIILSAIVGVFVQKDFGTTVILLLICFVIFMATPRSFYKKFKRVVWTCVGAGTILLVFAFNFIFKSYQVSRIYSWLDPLADYYQSSYQLANAMIAFANGGIFGVGLGNSTQKFGYIPEAHNDFIGAIIYEELGIFGLALIIIPTSIIIFRFLSYAGKIKDSKQRLILIGVASYFFFHLLINLGGISGLIPMTGVPLLLISSGGSSTVAALCAIGIGQSIVSRYNKERMNDE